MAKRYLLKTDEKGKQALLPWIEKHALRADCKTITADEAKAWHAAQAKAAAERRNQKEKLADRLSEAKAHTIDLEKITTKKELAEWAKATIGLEFPDLKDTPLAELKERARDALQAQGAPA